MGSGFSEGVMGLGLGAAPNPAGLFWCCGDCMGVTEGRVSLQWKPPDQRVGVCHLCGARYEFGSGYGEEELVAAGGRIVWRGMEVGDG